MLSTMIRGTRALAGVNSGHPEERDHLTRGHHARCPSAGRGGGAVLPLFGGLSQEQAAIPVCLFPWECLSGFFPHFLRLRAALKKAHLEHFLWDWSCSVQGKSHAYFLCLTKCSISASGGKVGQLASGKFFFLF